MIFNQAKRPRCLVSNFAATWTSNLGKRAVSLTWARFCFGGTACLGPVKWLGECPVEVVDSVAVATTATKCGVRSAETIKV